MTEREMMKLWVDTWKAAGPELEEIKARELQQLDSQAVIRRIFGGEGAFLKRLPMRTTSGMFEMQEWFAKLRKQ